MAPVGVRAVAAPQPTASATASVQPTAIGHGAGPGTSGSFSGLGLPGSGGRMGGGGIGIGRIGIVGGARMGGPPSTNSIRFTSRPTVTGPLPPEFVRRVVLRNILRFRHCFETTLGAAPTTLTTATLRFTITGTGSTANVSSQLGAPRPGVSPNPTQLCLNGVLASTPFPAAEGGAATQVEYQGFYGPPALVQTAWAAATAAAAPSSPPPSSPPPHTGPVPVAPST